MTTAPKPWSIKADLEGGAVLQDAMGKTFAHFPDGRDADEVLNLQEQNSLAIIERDDMIRELEDKIEELNERLNPTDDGDRDKTIDLEP